MRNYSYCFRSTIALVALLFGMEGGGMMPGEMMFFAGTSGGGLLPRGFVEVPSLKITAKGEASYLDTHVTVPTKGDILMECDAVSKEVFDLYICVGGVNGPSLSGQGMSMRAYPSWNESWYYTQVWNRRMTLKRVAYPAAVRFGVVDGEEYLSVNGSVVTGPLDGNERGTGGTTFTWGRASNPSDDFSGTILGRSRIRIGGDVVWEGIPCSRTDDGVVGYYDVVGKAFCPANANFAVGPEI